MSKVHSQSRITDNKGNARFQTYCANHKPQISWRTVPNDDIGIDGEVELYDKDYKPLAEIIKIQLKSTEKDKGYIKNENPNNNTFVFYAEKSHVEYWQKLTNDVLLVIYDNRNKQNKLYAKKIENIDLRSVGSKYVPIQFNKELDLIDEDSNDFLDRFSRIYNSEHPTIKSVAEGTEALVSNLLKISFPIDELFVAPINFDRDEVIKSSWQSKNSRWLAHDATAREVAWSALHQQNLKFSADWIAFNNQIITFHDLNNSDLSLSKIVDQPIDCFSPREFCSINDDYKYVFKSLLRSCLKQHLYKLNFEWDVDDNVFRYIAPKPITKNIDIKEQWTGLKRATRTVFKAKYYEENKVYYCQHFAFAADFKDFGNEWFLCIRPTWTVSINGGRKSRVSYKTVKALKKLERNKSVYNHLRFITYKLTFQDLFHKNYPFILFNDLAKFQTDKIIDEHEWLKFEDEEESSLLADVEEPTEIQNNENLLF
jgi:Domain of unknown function (DUF4365)